MSVAVESLTGDLRNGGSLTRMWVTNKNVGEPLTRMSVPLNH